MVKYSIVQVVKYDGTFGSVSCTHEGFFFFDSAIGKCDGVPIV